MAAAGRISHRKPENRGCRFEDSRGRQRHRCGRSLQQVWRHFSALAVTSTDISSFALDDIHENEVLFAIPQAAVLSVKNSHLRNHLPNELDSLDPWMSLVLVMIYESGQGPDQDGGPTGISSQKSSIR